MANKYVEISREEQKLLLFTVKNSFKLTWRMLAKELDIPKSSLFNYVNGTTIPLKRFSQLCSFINVAPNCFKPKFITLKYASRDVRIPNEITEKLSEFVGIIAGDGHVSGINGQIDICGHATLDAEYIERRVDVLFKDLFNTLPLKGHRPGVLYSRIHSKPLVSYLVNTFKIPLGKKKGKLRIPKIIFNNDLLVVAYLRGLFDTDGSIYRHHKNDIALDITSASADFRLDVKRAFEKLGFHPVINGKNVQLYRKKEINTFFKVIKPANPKHLKKYCFFNINGFLPKSTEFFKTNN